MCENSTTRLAFPACLTLGAERISLFARHGSTIPGIMAGVFISVAGKGAVMTAQGALAGWAERSALRRAGSLTTGESVPGRLRFVFYGRVSTEDWQDPVTSRARQREQAGALVRGHGVIVAELFDVGESRTVVWARRPQAAALVAQLADPDRGWDAIVTGEYERAFYGSQYAAMAPLFEHYGAQLWMPETGGRVDYQCEHDEKTMTVLGLSSKREITRTSIRVRTAMAAQTREQGRYLGSRPPYGYRLADAGPHPNKAHAAWGRRAYRLEPDPAAAPVVRWIFAQRLAGHSVARIARALNEAGVPCPSGVCQKFCAGGGRQERFRRPQGVAVTMGRSKGPVPLSIRSGVRCYGRVTWRLFRRAPARSMIVASGSRTASRASGGMWAWKISWLGSASM
jgi:DNA invertase Pin-like site-specific DNA recombinase